MSKYTRPPELTPEQRAANAAWFDRFVQLADQKLLVDKAPATTDAPGTDQQARAPVPRFLLLPANLSFVMNIPTNHIQVIADPFSRTTREFTIEMIHCRPPVDPEVVEMINTIEDVTCLPYIAPNTNGQAGYRWQCDPVEFSDCDRMSDDAMVGDSEDEILCNDPSEIEWPGRSISCPIDAFAHRYDQPALREDMRFRQQTSDGEVGNGGCDTENEDHEIEEEDSETE
jgi:hypothetical protein